MIVMPVHRRHHEPTKDQLAAGNYRKRKIPWQGMTISVENEAGSVRGGTNRDGTSWEVRMKYPYGYLRGTKGVDGDHVDCFVGPNPDAPIVYVIHARKVNRWDQYDEDKCMIGFDTEDDAKAAFLSCYNDPRFLGPVTAMPVAEFVEKARATLEKPAMIKALLLKAARFKYFSGTEEVFDPTSMPNAVFKQSFGDVKGKRDDSFSMRVGFPHNTHSSQRVRFEGAKPITRVVAYSLNPSRHKCGARCRHAKGNSCECECGGKNHGAGD